MKKEIHLLDLETELMRYKLISSALLIVLCGASVHSFMTPSVTNSCDPTTIEIEETSRIGSLLLALVVIYIFQYVARVVYHFAHSEYQTWLITNHDSQSFDRVEYLFYRIDYLYSHEDKFVLVVLGGVTIWLIVCGACGWWLFTGITLITFDDPLSSQFNFYYALMCTQGDSFLESLWASWTFVADPGDSRDLLRVHIIVNFSWHYCDETSMNTMKVFSNMCDIVYVQ